MQRPPGGRHFDYAPPFPVTVSPSPGTSRRLERTPDRNTPSVEVDTIGSTVNLEIRCDAVTVYHRVRQAVRSAQKRLANPEEIVGALPVQRHTGAHPRMDEKETSSDGGEGE